MSLTIDGQLEIDENRGVIYFHSLEGITVLRICQLPTPIPAPIIKGDKLPEMLDITLGFGCSWQKAAGVKKKSVLQQKSA